FLRSLLTLVYIATYCTNPFFHRFSLLFYLYDICQINISNRY
ncbi:hypothetical protein CLOSTASPAR_06523, partial [[Clostridium] asparagiforme DSM 15981]